MKKPAVDYNFLPWERDINLAKRVIEWARQQLINRLEGERASLSDKEVQRQGEMITGVAALAETLVDEGWEHHQAMKVVQDENDKDR